VRLYLLRHGEVTSHKGDVPITADAEQHAYRVGRRLADSERQPIAVLSGETRRAIDTATHLVRGIVDAGGVAVGPDVAFALRNPDLYVAGTRVNMVSSPEALADQVDGLSPEQVPSLDFFPAFMASPERIGWWLTHESPPGEDAAAIASRVRSFATSLLDPVPARPQVVVAVTHSPLLRAFALDSLGRDIGEPPWVAGLLVSVDDNAKVSLDGFGMDLP
jgi:broad specificity phosphatase PhoE